MEGLGGGDELFGGFSNGDEVESRPNAFTTRTGSLQLKLLATERFHVQMLLCCRKSESAHRRKSAGTAAGKFSRTRKIQIQLHTH